MLLKNRHGFTLIEIMTVLGIMAILMAIAIPSYIAVKPNLLLNRAVNEYYSILQQARLKAIKNRGNCTIVFAADSYTVSCDTSKYSRTVSYSDYGNIVIFERFDGASGIPTANLTFNSRGTSNQAYMHITNTDRSDFYRIGPLISGAIRKDKYMGGGAWQAL